jgi:hypothetical protein
MMGSGIDITHPMQRTLFALGVPILLSACSSGVETRVVSAGITPLAGQTYTIPAAEYVSADLKTAQGLVQSALTSRGYTFADTAPVHLQVTLDSRDAALALGTTSGPQSLSPAKRRKPLQSCADKEFRVGITLTRVADGSELYRSRVAEYHCKMPLADALPDLVNAALADLGRPRGSYSKLRSGID